MAKEFFHGIMVKDMKENGHLENRTAEELLSLKPENEKLVFGKMEEELKLKEKMIKQLKEKLDQTINNLIIFILFFAIIILNVRN
mgnify:CR=1 FL=1